MTVINYSNARKNFKSLIDKVNEDREAILITTKDPDNNAVIMSEAEYNSYVETIHLLRNPYNAMYLQKSLDQLEGNNTIDFQLDLLDE